MQYLPRASRYRRKKKGVNTKRLGTIVALVLLLVLTLACVHYYTLYAALRGSQTPAPWRPEAGKRIQFLLIGQSNNQVTACTLLSLPGDPEAPASVLRIPPATLFGGSDAGCSFGTIFSEEGIESALKELDGALANSLPVNHYVAYDVAGIAAVLSALESVDVDLPEGFQVQRGDTSYIFAAGANEINDLNLAPFIAPDANHEKAAFWAEKSLLVAVFNELFSLKHISYLLRNVGAVSDCYESDLNTRQLARFRNSLQALSWEVDSYMVLPGRWLDIGGNRYWSSDHGLVETTVQQIIENIPGYDKSALKIDIFNGNGVDGFAGSTAMFLKGYNFEVDKVENAPLSENTHIYYEEEYRLAAIEIAFLLGVEADLVPDPYYDSDNPVAVVLGKDLVSK